MLTLVHYLTGGSPELPFACHHLPERHAKRVQVRADIYAHSRELLGTSKLWSAGKAPRRRNRGLRTFFTGRPGKSKVDDFREHGASVLHTHHDVAWLDVAVDKLLLVQGSQT